MAAKVYAGIDIGGTNIKIGLVDDSAQTVAFESIPTQSELGPEDAARRVAETLEQLTADAGTTLADLAAVGLASPGPMDLKSGMLLCPGNLPEWHNTPLRQLFADAVGKPVHYSNDANAAAYGEYWGGAGHRFDSLVMFTLGTGVGGGIILGDLVIDGAHSCGSELGHIIIDAADDAPLNSLGIRGTLEGYCGSYGVVGRAKAAIADRFLETSLRDTLEEDEELTPLQIANAAEAGDELAIKVVLDTAKYLAIGIVTAVHSIDPEGVVIGGAMTFGGTGHPLGERFLGAIRQETNDRLIPSLRGQIAIEFAKLGGDAGYIGTAGLARAALAR
ncbi:Glucokinase [Planctomycetes bacterium MalM25]|nr:Glucokinase [Planctomycetes bacterium MalM25]